MTVENSQIVLTPVQVVWADAVRASCRRWPEARKTSKTQWNGHAVPLVEIRRDEASRRGLPRMARVVEMLWCRAERDSGRDSVRGSVGGMPEAMKLARARRRRCTPVRVPHHRELHRRRPPRLRATSISVFVVRINSVANGVGVGRGE